MDDIHSLNTNPFFGAEPISYNSISDIGNQSADLIVYAIPVMPFYFYGNDPFKGNP